MKQIDWVEELEEAKMEYKFSVIKGEIKEAYNYAEEKAAYKKFIYSHFQRYPE